MFKNIFATCVLITLLFASTFAISGKSTVEFSPKTNPADELVLEAINNYLNQINEKLYFNQVVSLKTQVVSGLNYFLTVEFLNADKKAVNYEVQVYVVPWEKYSVVKAFQRLNTEKVEFNQPQFMKDQMENMPTKFIKAKISEQTKGGAQKEINFDNEEKLIKTQVLAALSNKTNQPLDYIKIISATKQIVNGIKYNISFTDGMGTYVTDVIVTLYNNKVTLQNFQILEKFNTSQIKIEEPQVGGSQKVNFDEEDKEITGLVKQFLMSKVNASQDQLEILSASKQIVSGLMYDLYFTDGAEKFFAQVIVKLWENQVELTDFKVLGRLNKAGGEQDLIDFYEEDQMIIDLVNKQLVQQTNNGADIKVLKAKKQVINGLKYGLTFTDGQVKYYADVFVQLWNGSVKIENFKVLGQKKTQQSSGSGSENKIDFYNEDQEIIDFITKKIGEKINANGNMVKVLKAKKQVVNGLRYSLVFTDGIQKYKTDLIVRLWEQFISFENFQVLSKENKETTKTLFNRFDGGFNSIDFNAEDESVKSLIMGTLVGKLNTLESSIKVINAQKQIVNGVKYDLVFSDKVDLYEAVVLVNLREDDVKIISLEKQN